MSRLPKMSMKSHPFPALAEMMGKDSVCNAEQYASRGSSKCVDSRCTRSLAVTSMHSLFAAFCSNQEGVDRLATASSSIHGFGM